MPDPELIYRLVLLFVGVLCVVCLREGIRQVRTGLAHITLFTDRRGRKTKIPVTGWAAKLMGGVQAFCSCVFLVWCLGLAAWGLPESWKPAEPPASPLPSVTPHAKHVASRPNRPVKKKPHHP